jgi:hypothetical protein
MMLAGNRVDLVASGTHADFDGLPPSLRLDLDSRERAR